ncbi:amidase-domain-containing protein [Jimgerdemannia flammicorona]|uniref:Amidase-domain-containing protein n=1 Tax=Jimgerdemannia flammicorona TaxID=994334 RepID=A0A433A2Z6_9FUNG|nr:amidase-domain-containing protein [Jimgerdemannia flammicorona]
MEMRETHRSEAEFLRAKVSEQDNIARRRWVYCQRSCGLRENGKCARNVSTLRYLRLLPPRRFAAGVSVALEGIHVVLLELYFPTNRVILIPPLLPAERVVRQQNLDPKYRAIPMPCRQSLTDDGKIVENQLSSLDGMPVAVKDNFCTTQISSLCGSAIIKGFTSPYDVTVVHLRKAGAVVMGKTNLDEFKMG